MQFVTARNGKTAEVSWMDNRRGRGRLLSLGCVWSLVLFSSRHWLLRRLFVLFFIVGEIVAEYVQAFAHDETLYGRHRPRGRAGNAAAPFEEEKTQELG